ncbi:hypothetical protein [Bradyrhizobium australafricanum]|uniref:hypothetical protein n=1 Tax=Bradyrhizobium australafricanum TaxID=2821406 RepID=UPI001CE38E77|nr:hypothetical protein [Bradyrhizobium australafricanum]MCA6098848.1 hypothetical protein [Bradyrhizobium australafricanum]
MIDPRSAYIKDIPTYADINFMSRLEARWAALFDLMGWRWSYQPLDFNEWTPDFIIHGAKQRVLVEVYPIFAANEDLLGRISRAAIGSGKRNDILVVGAEPLWDVRGWCCPAFGWLGELCGPEHGHGWGEAIVHDGGGLGFCHSILQFRNRITGHHDGDSVAGAEGYDGIIRRAWARAGNAVQWRPDEDNESIIAIVDRAVRKASRNKRHPACL